MKKLLCICALVCFGNLTFAQYTSPGTGVVWSLNDLMTNAPDGVISLSDGVYTISQNITIASTDELLLAADVVIAIDPDIQLTIDGTFRITADAVTITASDPEAPYDTIRFSDGSTGFLTNATINYGTGIRVSTGDFEMHACSMSYHAISPTISAALTFSTGSPVVANSEFKFNVGPAFGSGANQEVAAMFTGNYLEGNNTANSNRPQINMGPSGNDTIRIVNNIIKGNPALTMVGGISASSLLGNPNRVIIDGNVITDNRYGITVQGANSSGYIRNNIIEDNNTQNLPAQGGSGISLSASGAATMNIIASGNQIRRNLWGITVINQARINLGTANPDDDSPGGNIFSENGNGGQVYALFNNTPHAIDAANNCWIEGTEPTAADVEGVISHQADDANLGIVNYTPFSCMLSVVDNQFVRPLIYPNPVADVFVIRTPWNADAELFNIHGQLVRAMELREGENVVQADLPSGVYIVRMRSSHGTFVARIVSP